ncbi:hypothetical protein [Solidesulfovibrio sp.]
MTPYVALPAGQWPEAMEHGRIDDAAFAAAYARSTDTQRAWIKTGLAAVYAALGGPMPASRLRRDALGHNLLLTDQDVPLDYVVIVCGRDFLSPSRLAAAVVPALCARVAEVAAVRVGGVWPRPLLTTLELCGVETACRVAGRDLVGLLAALPAKGRGAVVVLGGLRLPTAIPAAVEVYEARIARRAGVFAERDAAFDTDALDFAHPDMAFFQHGGVCPDRPSWASGPGGLAEALPLGYDAVYAAPARVSEALAAAPLVLGPGRETFWLWPKLPPRIFRVRRLAAGAVATLPAAS